MPRRPLKLFVTAVTLALSALVCACGSAPETVSTPPGDAPMRTIALTFDDAPRGDGPFFTGPERATALLEALDAVGVEGAMFFVQTGNVAARDDGGRRLERYVAAGHVLANHSHTHPWLSRDTTVDDYIADIDQAIEVLQGFEGVEPFYRFPFLDEGRPVERRDAVRAALVERGLRQGYVTVDNYDWSMNALATEAIKAGHDVDREVLGEVYVETLIEAVAFYDRIAVEALGRSPHHVLLLHENDLAALYVDDLVRALQADGWTIVPATVAYTDPIADHLPETLFLGQGRVAAMAHEDGLAKPRDLISEDEDEAVLRALFEQRGLLPTATSAQ